MEVAPPPQKRLYMANMAFLANMTTAARWLDFNMTGYLMAKWLDGKIVGWLCGYTGSFRKNGKSKTVLWAQNFTNS